MKTPTPSAPADKATWRERLGSRCQAVTASEARRAADGAARQLGAWPRFAEATRIGLYAALPDELGTGPIQALVRARGLPLLWPRVVGAALEFAEARPEGLVAGAFGIPVPPPDIPAATLGRGDLLLIPGRGFDQRGVRLGRGGGFYDRTGLSAPGLVCVGLGYAFQLVERLPAEPHDLRVEAVLTDAGVHPTRTT